MKLIAIGDIHGRTIWKDIVEAHSYDRLIFIGDYFDSKEDIDAESQMKNFIEICRLKKENPEKVILLLGNHDYHYLDHVGEEYSDFQADFFVYINQLVQGAVDAGLLQTCYLHEKFLFTHAGVTKTWCAENNIDVEKIPDSINECFHSDRLAFRHNALHDHTSAISPIWVRPDTLIPDKIDGYVQVVGHTKHQRVTAIDDVYFIDNFSYAKEFLVIDGGKFIVDTL